MKASDSAGELSAGEKLSKFWIKDSEASVDEHTARSGAHIAHIKVGGPVRGDQVSQESLKASRGLDLGHDMQQDASDGVHALLVGARLDLWIRAHHK